MTLTISYREAAGVAHIDAGGYAYHDWPARAYDRERPPPTMASGAATHADARAIYLPNRRG